MRNIRFVKYLLLVIFVLTGALSARSQDILKGQDLSQIRVNQLTDADVEKFGRQLTSAGMSIEDAEAVALSKGMRQEEFNRLKERLQQINNRSGNVSGKLKAQTDADKLKKPGEKDTTDLKDIDRKPLINPLIFGSELYTAQAPNFEPNMKMATPANYTLGADDELNILVYGVQQYEGNIKVDVNGSISVPNVGLIKVGGMTLEAATQKIKSALANSVYPYLKSGGSSLSVTLNKFRSISVTIIGANRPGNYTLSSLSTVFNALYSAGGPSAFGSFREIKLVRNSRTERTVDLYRLLVNGDQSDNVALKDNDIIIIPSYKKRIEIQGQVKRPGIFEVLPGEKFADMLTFASGFTDTAFEASVKVFQRSATQRRLKDIEMAAFKTYEPQTGDIFVVSKIADRFENRVKITGAVYRPDVYELTDKLTVGELIRKSGGLKEDAYTNVGQVLRFGADLTPEILSFDVRKALAGSPADDIPLMREDEVLINSITELRDSLRVTIQGEVHNPGRYVYVSNLTLKDLILQAGGFTDAAYKNIEIARVIKRDSLAISDNRSSQIINAEVSGDLNSASANIKLSMYDVITVRRKAGYVLPESVLVTGQVQYPGPYTLSSIDERVSSILKRAGGFAPNANPAGAYLKRYKTEDDILKAKQSIEKLKKSIRSYDSLANESIYEEAVKEYTQIPLDLPKILNTVGSVEDLVLRSKDELVIPAFDGQVKISGSVLLATQVPYQAGNSLGDYVNTAGGYSADAWKRKAYVVYANGRAATTKHFLFFKSYPKILPGSEVVVPKKADKKNLSTGEIIGLSSALASVAGIVIAILQITK